MGKPSFTQREELDALLSNFSPEEWLEWMIANYGGLHSSDRERLFPKLCKAWQELRTPNSTIEQIRRFLRSYSTTLAFENRALAAWGEDDLKTLRAVYRPFIWALASPDSPFISGPWKGHEISGEFSQEKIDTELGEFFRAQILSKNADFFENAARALRSIECDLYPGINEGTIFSSLSPEIGKNFNSPKVRLIEAFFQVLENEKRLPNKGEIVEMAGKLGKRKSEYLKELGLSGLPTRAPHRNT